MTSVSCPSATLSFAPAARPARAAGARKAAVTCWQLESGRAMTFTALAPGAIGVSGGQLWLTFTNTGRIDAAGEVDTVRAHPLRQPGDFLLRPGDRFELAAGDTVVLESTGAEAETSLEWQAGMDQRQPADVPRGRPADAGGRPHELRQAIGHAVLSIMRLAMGLAMGLAVRLAGFATASRAELHGRTFDAFSSDPSVQCRLY
jgi:Protein of unknown function (DUF2917)